MNTASPVRPVNSQLQPYQDHTAKELVTRKMCFDIGIVTCGPNEALVISGMCQVSGNHYNQDNTLLVIFPIVSMIKKTTDYFCSFDRIFKILP